MTVHAAKGLEFPVVFLVNLGKGQAAAVRPSGSSPTRADGLPSVSIGDYLSDADADAVDREREETKRLLYVAMTRARDRSTSRAVVAGERFRRARAAAWPTSCRPRSPIC